MTFHQKPWLGMQLNRKHKLAKGLVGCWVMNELTGDKIFDLSGNCNHGEINGADWVVDGLDFNGTSDYVEVPYDTSFDFPDGTNITIVSWFKTTATKDWNGLMSKYDVDAAPYEGFGFGLNNPVGADGKVYFGCDFAGGPTLTPLTYHDGELHCAIGTINGTTVSIYMDGVHVVSETKSPDLFGNTDNNLYIGTNNYEYSTGRIFDGIILSTSLYKRALSAEEVAYLHREPYAMFEQPISPAQLYYELVGDVSTDLLHGKIIIKDSSIVLVDGLVKVQDISTDLFDGKLQVQDTDTDLADGLISVKDSATDLADGKVQVQDTTTDLTDGKVQIQDSATDIVDGKLKVGTTNYDLADGKVQIQDSVTDLADGKVIVTTAGLDTGYADGKIQIKDVTTGIVDGLIKVKDSVTGLADGKVKISNIGSNLADGLIQIKDTATGIADGKVRIKDVATGTADGLLKVIKRATSNIDGKLKIKDSIKDLADGKISITGVATAIIRRITIANKKPSYRLVAEQPKPTYRLETENK